MLRGGQPHRGVGAQALCRTGMGERQGKGTGVAENYNTRRVAIACQGGGSHTAFTAGALKKLLQEKGAEGHEYEIVALSGTSGGSICALLVWCGFHGGANGHNK